MISWAKIRLLVIIIVLVVINDVAGGCEVNCVRNLKCQGDKIEIEKMKDDIAECRKKIGDVDDNTVMMRKIYVCIFEKEGAVLDNKVSEERFKGMITKIFAENGEALGNLAYEDCVTSKPSNVENLSKDDDAKSYGPFVKCMLMKMHEHCEKEQ